MVSGWSGVRTMCTSTAQGPVKVILYGPVRAICLIPPSAQAILECTTSCFDRRWNKMRFSGHQLQDSIYNHLKDKPATNLMVHFFLPGLFRQRSTINRYTGPLSALNKSSHIPSFQEEQPFHID